MSNPKARKQCKKVCYEWTTLEDNSIEASEACEHFKIKNSKPTCKLHGKLKSQVTGQVFYLGRVVR